MELTGPLDPTLLFVVMTFCIVAAKTGDVSQAIAFLTCPAVIAMYCLIAAAVWWAGNGPQPRLQPWEKRAAMWYLLNGCVFHFFMDGLSGGWGLGGPLGEQYKQLDRRVFEKHPDAWAVLNLELFVMTPLCVLTYRAVRQNLPSRIPLEIMMCTIHICGTVMFILPELLSGCVHVPTDEPAGGEAGPCWVGLLWPPSENQLVMFWFGFVFANIPWCVVPLRLLLTAISAGTNEAKAAAAHSRR
eukprot:TRINITY_DN11950_c0_g1_i1.p1 TRINITY_DN11950_c0_g1~~TRINITY_DN11950_c0_g1_i1.p1  ORF type:complete len:243 (+),score=77.18 TRINITY_DN11950_c0_g1_i1:72-800(+)